MTRLFRILSIAVGGALLCAACSQRASYPDVTLVDFCSAASAVTDGNVDAESAARTLITDNPRHSHALAQILGSAVAEDDTLTLASWLTSPAVSMFAPEVDSHAPGLTQVARALGFTLGRMAQDSLAVPADGFATVVWAKPLSIIFCDSVMLVALNHYLGAEHTAYENFETYRRAVKTPEMMPYDMAEALVSTAYPYERSDSATLINRLVYEGAVALAKMRLVENATEAQALGYDEDTYKQLLRVEQQIWDKMVSTGMIFDASPVLEARMVQPAPFSADISQDVPGRVGRFIGYRIVKKYCDNNDASLRDLLSPNFYNKRNPLIGSGYTGR